MANVFSRRDFMKLSGITAAGLGGASLITACGGSGSSAAGSDVVKLGLMGPFSGNVAQYGIAVRNGAQLYVKQINEAGGIEGKKIELVTEDEKGDAAEAVNVYNKMVEDGVVGIIGDVTSTPSIAVAKAAANDNMPLVSASATAADFIAFGSNAFRACITDPYQGKLMADFAAQQGYKTVATLYNNGGDYEVGVNKAFVDQAKAKGLTVAVEESYSTGDVDFNAQLTKIIAANPDAVLLPNYYQEDGQIIKAARKLGYDKVFLGADGWSNIVGGSEEYATYEELKGCFYDCSFILENDDKKVQEFVSAYQAEYKESPTNFCALGYDAAMVLVSAIGTVLKGGAKDLASNDGKQATIDAIASGSVNGVTGTIKYNGTGDPVKPTLVITFEDGAQKVFTTIEA